MKNRLAALILPALLLALAPLANAQRVEATSTGTGTTARWTFAMGPMSFKSGPKGAGRIISLQYNGSEVLHMDTNTATNYGSTFWPTPQAGWTSNWPPAANIDGSGAYTATYSDSTLVLNGQTDANNKVRINKAYWANLADSSYNMRFTLINTNTAAKSWGPWQDTRIPAGGLYVFPKGDTVVTGQLAGLTKDTLGYIWFKYDSATVLTSGTNKFYTDGKLGWYAHINKNKVVLIKKFTDTPLSKKAPGVENEIELYTTNDKKFVEMEAQGEYRSIPAGDSIVWNMKWLVRKMPDTTTVKVGNMDIVNFINTVVGQVTAVEARQPARGGTSFRMSAAGESLRLTLAQSASVSLVVMDARGSVVQRLHSGALEAGSHSFRLAPAAKGLYWLVLRDARGADLEVRALPRL